MWSKMGVLFFAAVLVFSTAVSADVFLNSPSTCSGQWSGCANAFADSANSAVVKVSATASKSGTWGAYGLSIPEGAAINSVVVRADFYSNKPSGYAQIQVSGDGGATFGPVHTIGNTTVETSFSLDVTNDIAWSPAKLGNGNLVVKATCIARGHGNNPTCYLDWMPVQVAYTPDSVPSASASVAPASGVAPLTVNFTGSATGGDAPMSYLWIFGDGANSTQQNPAHTYMNAGTYTASFSATDFDGDSSTSYVSIAVSPACVGANPLVSIAPFIQNGTYGAMRVYTMSVTNMDSSACSSSAFSLSSAVPSGWNGVFATGNMTISPGSTSGTAFFLTPPNATPGYYTFTNTATNMGAPAYSGTSSAAYFLVG